MHVTISLFMEGHVLLTDINEKTVTTTAKENLANVLLYPKNMEFIYS